jgi:hypothetical protein
MTNDEFPMTKEFPNPNDESTACEPTEAVGHSGRLSPLVIRVFFRHSALVIPHLLPSRWLIALGATALFINVTFADLAVRHVEIGSRALASRVPEITAQGRFLAPQAISAVDVGWSRKIPVTDIPPLPQPPAEVVVGLPIFQGGRISGSEHAYVGDTNDMNDQ